MTTSEGVDAIEGTGVTCVRTGNKFCHLCNANVEFCFSFEVANLKSELLKVEVLYVPSASDPSCHPVGWRIFCDAHQQHLSPPATCLRGDFSGSPSVSRE
jgi:hypothetical protein